MTDEKDIKKTTNWRSKRENFLKIIKDNLPSDRIKEELGDIQKGWDSDVVGELLSEEDKKKLNDYEKLTEKEKNNKTVETFTCNNCSREWKTKYLAKEVEVVNSPPIKTCRECYNFYHNPPQEKTKEELFTCDYCRQEIIGTRFHRKVSVSMPNELGLIHSQVYDLCFSCNPKVREYNEHEDINEGKRELEEWE